MKPGLPWILAIGIKVPLNYKLADRRDRQNKCSITGDPAMNILALDLGKSKTVSCLLDSQTAQHRYETVKSTPFSIHQLFERTQPDRIVFETSVNERFKVYHLKALQNVPPFL